MLQINARKNLLVDGRVAADQWQLISKAQAGNITGAAAVPAGKVILPYALWHSLAQELVLRRAQIGVWLDSDESAELLADSAGTLPLIAIHFPIFMDGRGFSSARLLRERYGFTGELRAVGAFMRDQLTFLRRCGINTFVFEGEEPLEVISQSLHDFSDAYQADSDHDLPIFRRRALS